MKTFFHPDLSLGEEAFISLSKAPKVMRHLFEYERVVPHMPGFPILSEEDFHRLNVHDTRYVRLVFAHRANGFNQPFVPSLTRQIAVANSAEIAAVEYVLRQKQSGLPDLLACAPVSGFHHAGYANGTGYCTLNGLVLSIANAMDQGLLSKDSAVLIIDGDAHYGDGTDSCLSVKGSRPYPRTVMNWTRERDWDTAADWRMIEQIMGLAHWDLVLYQAGADAHMMDPYKAGVLTDTDWLERDLAVFKYVVENKIPCVWNFAGGYHPTNTVALHARTWITAARLSARALPPGTQGWSPIPADHPMAAGAPATPDPSASASEPSGPPAAE